MSKKAGGYKLSLTLITTVIVGLLLTLGMGFSGSSEKAVASGNVILTANDIEESVKEFLKKYKRCVPIADRFTDASRKLRKAENKRKAAYNEFAAAEGEVKVSTERVALSKKVLSVFPQSNSYHRVAKRSLKRDVSQLKSDTRTLKKMGSRLVAVQKKEKRAENNKAKARKKVAAAAKQGAVCAGVIKLSAEEGASSSSSEDELIDIFIGRFDIGTN